MGCFLIIPGVYMNFNSELKWCKTVPNKYISAEQNDYKLLLEIPVFFIRSPSLYFNNHSFSNSFCADSGIHL